MKALVIIPTYNERDNIIPLMQEILKQVPDIHILVVDDNSPDGTGQAVDLFTKSNSRVSLLSRSEKKGLGRAYVAGFDWGISRGFEFLIEMDADFSHRPEDLQKIVKAGHEGADFVVGSRYTFGGGTRNWGMGRKLLSRGGNIYSRCILGYPLTDWTGGFNGWNKKVLKAMGLESIQSDGYSFQVELKYRALRLGFIPTEIPIIFEERRIGQSKMSSKIVVEALVRVWALRFS